MRSNNVRHIKFISGMPDIDYGQFSQYLQDTAHYRMMERLDKLNTTPPYLDAIQEHNERVEEARQANIRTAEHTAAMNEQLGVMIKNQGQLIESQKELLAIRKSKLNNWNSSYINSKAFLCQAKTLCWFKRKL